MTKKCIETKTNKRLEYMHYQKWFVTEDIMDDRYGYMGNCASGLFNLFEDIKDIPQLLRECTLSERAKNMLLEEGYLDYWISIQ